MIKGVTIDIMDVYYDVRNNSFVTGNSRQDGTNFELVANMQASDDPESANKICRAIQKAMGDLITDLAEYEPNWQDDSSTTTTSTYMTQATQLQVTFENLSSKDTQYLKFSNLPSNFNSNVLPSIAQSVHAYLYEKAMMDWFLTTDKNDAKDYEDLSMNSILTIRRAINKRDRPDRSLPSA